ncbi:MAG: B12-binding domain-containing radical SAM protein [Enhygromyxa sp.]
MRSRSPRIAFVAVDLRWEDETGYFAPFSYAAYKLEAAIRGCEELEHVETRVFELETRDPEVFFEALREYQPTLVAASTYLWSLPTFVSLAKLLRAHDPSVAFVMGGPSARRSMLELPPYREDARHIDAVVFGDGEVVIRQLAHLHLDAGWRDKIPGLNYRTALGWRSTGELGRPVLDDYVTPYHLGTAPPGKMGFYESYRGCPIACAFCQWGDQRSDRVYGREYLASMLRHLDASGVKDVFCLDAALNLSPRAFRNLLEAEREVRALADRRLQCHLYPLQLKDEHYEFIELVGNFQAAIGIQSLDPEVLEVLGRPFEPARFAAAIASMRDAVTLDMEFIMGLPRDNPKSFRETFHKVVDMSDNVRVFWCLALPDAFLERVDEFDIRFDPKTLMVESCQGWTYEDMRREWDYMLEFGSGCERFHCGPNWLGFTTPAGVERTTAASHIHEGTIEVVTTLPTEARERLASALGRQASGWQLRSARRDRQALLLELDSPRGGVVLEVVRFEEGAPCFTRRGDLAYSYRGSLEHESALGLRRVIELIHSDMADMEDMLGLVP